MKQNIIMHAARAASLLIISTGGITSSASADLQSISALAGTCSMYDPRPKCTEDSRNAKRKQFGLPTLEKIRQQNKHNGSNSELIVATLSLKAKGGVALVMHRDRKGAPTIEIRRMLSRGRLLQPRPTRVKIREEIWNIIVAKGEALNLVYANNEVLICGATFTVELVDKMGNIRAPVGDNCGNEPRGLFFEVLAEAALAQLPQCASLYPNEYNATLDRITRCFALKVDA